MTKSCAIRIDHVRKAFAGRVILDAITLELQAGELNLLSGINGAGKSTLLRILAGLEKPDAGEFDLGTGAKTWRAQRRKLLAHSVYLHQAPFMFEGSVSYNLGYALSRQLSDSERMLRIDQALKWAGLEALANQSAKSLSGGERQRVALARAWLCNPRVLLLDEPTANMDTEASQRTLSLLQILKDAGQALLVASHDPGHFSALTNHHYQLDGGRLTALEHPQLVGQDTARITTLKRASL